MKFYCKYCNKIKELNDKGFCSEEHQNKFIDEKICGRCVGNGRIACMAGGTEQCPSCGGCGKGDPNEEVGFC